MLSATLTVLRRPATAFEDRGGAITPLRSAALPLVASVVAVASLFPTIVAVLDLGLDLGAIEAVPTVRYALGTTAVAVPGDLAGTVGVVFAGPLVVWMGFGVAFHLLSWVAATEGSLGRTLAYTSWGFLPQVLASLLTLGAITVTFSGSLAPVRVAAVTLPARTVFQQAGATPLLLAVNAAGVACTVWSGYVWMHAVRAARGLTRRQAVAVVAPLVAASLLLGPPLSRLLA